MSLPEEHFQITKELVRSLDNEAVAEWLLTEGYYPEPYVFPPNFTVDGFELKEKPYYQVERRRNKGHRFYPKLDSFDILNISYPKSELTDRIFGIYHPKLYHDIIWHLHNKWDQIVNHLFSTSTNIYSYSFPIPLNTETLGEIGKLRAGRNIYEYLELVEKDLIAESYKYKYLLRTDVKNFYPSIYTHSISWALHTIDKIRGKNEHNLWYVGNILDRLFQYANNRKTNGISIGPSVSDLIAEIILAAIDKNVSKELRREDFLGARFKDDYYFLVNSERTIQNILKVLQARLKDFNLIINEEKTNKLKLPDGLQRPWIKEFDIIWNSLNHDPSDMLTFKNFTLLSDEVLRIDSKYPNTGVIEKYLSKLSDYNYQLKIDYSNENNIEKAILRTLSLLMHFSNRNKRSLTSALGVIEAILNAPEENIPNPVKERLIEELKIVQKNLSNEDDEHKKLWWIYFVLSNEPLRNNINVSTLYNNTSKFIRSINRGEQRFFSEFSDCSLFEEITVEENEPILKHLDLFDKD